MGTVLSPDQRFTCRNDGIKLENIARLGTFTPPDISNRILMPCAVSHCWETGYRQALSPRWWFVPSQVAVALPPHGG